MSHKVLFVAYFYPPLANSGTQRPLKLANYLPEFGWEPLVLTVDTPPDCAIDRQLIEEVRPGTHVTRVKMLSDVVGNAIARPLSGAPRVRASVSSGISWRMR